MKYLTGIISALLFINCGSTQIVTNWKNPNVETVEISKVLIVGSDLWDLRPHHIEEALKVLDHNDVVIGPAQDGGYYLLGMKTLIKNVFYHKEWGTDTVYKDTRKDLEDKKVYTLETLNDIDHAEDLHDYLAFKHYFTR